MTHAGMTMWLLIGMMGRSNGLDCRAVRKRFSTERTGRKTAPSAREIEDAFRNHLCGVDPFYRHGFPGGARHADADPGCQRRGARSARCGTGKRGAADHGCSLVRTCAGSGRRRAGGGGRFARAGRICLASGAGHERTGRHRRQHSAAAGLHLPRRNADRDDHGLHRTARQRDAHRPLPDPREASGALFEPVQQCADAVHAAADLGRHRPACRPYSRSPGVAWLCPASARLRAPAVHGNPGGHDSAHHRRVAVGGDRARRRARRARPRQGHDLAMAGDVRGTLSVR